MDESEAKRCHESLLKFISDQGRERAEQIKRQGQDEFKGQRDSYIKEEQARITNEYNARIAQDEIKLKIQRSANENNARINKMKTVNALIEKLYKEAEVRMIERQQHDIAQYKEFLKNLILQGLIKLMEGDVFVRCRRSDLPLVNEVYKQAADEYKHLMQTEVKIF